MGEYRIIADNRAFPMGLTRVLEGFHIKTAAVGTDCRILLFQREEEEPCCTLSFPSETRQGDVFSMTVSGDFSGISYCFEIDGKRFTDPYGTRFLNHQTWGDLEHAGEVLKCPFEIVGFDWEGDRILETPFEETIIYRIHCRGFTKHSSSGVKGKGTFLGIMEKIPYLKELGITAVELLPVNEFQEVVIPDYVPGNPYGVDKPTGKLNYWGYAPGYYFSPKASFASDEADPVTEFKMLVKTLHDHGIELITELYFTGKEPASFVLDVVRFWVNEFHVDGIHLAGIFPQELLKSDPYLSRVKLIANSWEEKISGNRHLGECNDGFLVDMRRTLKGDEDQMKSLAFHIRRNPADRAVINYMAGTNGFTMMDMVSYDTRHNEENGENNQDGNPYNYSWNCGVEGATKKRSVLELRKRQLRNAFLLLMLSQGTPLFLAGDEFGNSQSGNNNAYCQDNEVTWLNWNLKKKNQDLFFFVKNLIAFRKSHPVFHQKEEPRLMDYLACGLPDLSYHGVRAWCPEYENFRRQLGVLYCGEYGVTPDGKTDHSFYLACNMHWEPHEFDLPNGKRGKPWYVLYQTNEKNVNGIDEQEEQLKVESRRYLVPARTIVVLIEK
ncbi:alpha-amylase family glycosyl hydrolase [Clostridium sp. HBUAS56010]|uniref:alpha-amylase family glycosyl hydrolase n=1 Tax=Clostridium sp. HBUAS56010 TaxID=2571127 RepID=UPI0011785559|nr:alpha-amylase family glycosyl hydrolase [Clostridium sp. HBUAS56010]